MHQPTLRINLKFLTLFLFVIFFTILVWPVNTFLNAKNGINTVQILEGIKHTFEQAESINQDDLNCNIQYLETYNLQYIYPILNELLSRPYFRFFKVNLNKKCPFWPNSRICASQYCHIRSCDKNLIPIGLRSLKQINGNIGYDDTQKVSNESVVANGNNTGCHDNATYDHDHMPNKANGGGNISSNLNLINTNITGPDVELLNAVNRTISDTDALSFQRWSQHDSTLKFCDIDDETSHDCEYIDLLLNPEQYTSFNGPAAHKIWKAIYEENCFFNHNLQNDRTLKRKWAPILSSHEEIKDLCFEKRAFYMALSGLHTSITTHLCSRYYINGKFTHNPIEWGQRFDYFSTQGESSRRLRNLYFTYLLELRALAKVSSLLKKEQYYTGNVEDDTFVNSTMHHLLNSIKNFGCHFDEHTMFLGHGNDTLQLKEEIRSHFLNISRIMDCVSCDKCRLWGKLQTQGLGTAFKILFDPAFSNPRLKKRVQLQRTEIVSLINAFGRLSTSIYEISTYYRNLTSTEMRTKLKVINPFAKFSTPLSALRSSSAKHENGINNNIKKLEL